jgi:RNA-directed DNA polymerase
MTDNQKKLSRHEMSTTEGVRAEGDTIRDRTQNSSADLTVGTPPVCGDFGYHRIHGEETKPVPEASSIAYESRCETARDLVPDADRLVEPVCARCETDAAVEPSLWPAVSAPGGKAGRLQGPRVNDRNAGTRVSPPVFNTPASSSESSEDGRRGRSSRSSPRPVRPVTRRRGTDVSSGFAKEEPPVDSGEQVDQPWLLDIQRKLYTWSRNHPGRAWQDMWGWLTNPRNLRLAWRRVARNRGARSAGVDKVTVKRIEQRVGVERFLGDLGERLRSGRYLPSPVRRVMIPKRGKPGQFRPLGVPTVEDRVVQAAILQLLEPIFEAEFYPVSYGFRPKRSVRDAVEHLRLAIKPPKERSQPRRLSPPYQWVIEGDIKACFDNIDHHTVMTRLRRRVGDRKVTRLVGAFLKAGVLAEDTFLRSDAGTPQGGILSPLLANVVLSAIEARYKRYIAPGRTRDGKTYVRPGDQVRKFRHRERKAGRPVFVPVRYADDFVVLVAGTEQQAHDEKEALAAYLGQELKLTLSAEKTRVTPLTEGFEFLGHRIRLRWDDRWGFWPRVEIPKERVRDLCYRIKQLTNRGHTYRAFQAVLDGLNPVLRGWGNFYRHCYYAKDVFTRVDHYVWDRLRRWLRKKYPKTPRLAIHRRYWRRSGERPRFRWVDVRPVAIMADIPVGRRNLLDMGHPDYAQQTLESPVHNERCTPGSGAGGEETTAGNRGTGALSPRSRALREAGR